MTEVARDLCFADFRNLIKESTFLLFRRYVYKLGLILIDFHADYKAAKLANEWIP